MAGAALAERQAGQPVESFGKPGQGPGSFRRWVAMGGEPMTTDGFVDLAQSAYKRGRRELATDGRIIAKGLVVPDTRAQLVNGHRAVNPLTIEGVFPVTGRDGGDMSFVIAGANGPDRGMAVDPALIRSRVDLAVKDITPRSAGQSVERAVEQVDLVPFIPEGLEQSLVDLWGARFGWDLPGVMELRRALDHQLTLPTSDRTQFGTFAIKHEDSGSRIVGANIIEGREFDGIYVGETTEWAADASVKGHRIGEAVVATSNVQFLTARGQRPHALLAELNTSSATLDAAPPAVAVGIRTGLRPFEFETADKDPLPQILTHHVGVGDENPLLDHEITMFEGNGKKSEFPVRAFLLARLTSQAEEAYYSPDDIAFVSHALLKGERSLAHAGYPRTRS